MVSIIFDGVVVIIFLEELQAKKKRALKSITNSVFIFILKNCLADVHIEL